MGLFNFEEKEVLTSHFADQQTFEYISAVNDIKIGKFGSPEKNGMLSFISDSKANISSNLLSDQFIVFQLSGKTEEPALLESSLIDPVIEGSEMQPDMLINLEMLNFNIAEDEKISPDTKATMRITIGKDENSTNRNFDTAFWCIASGLNLFNQSKNEKSNPKELKSDFRQAFGNRPIEIPGSLSKMEFQVVKHKEPKWWQNIFRFLQSNVGQTLTSSIGFPAVTSSAIHMIDELLNKIERNEPEILFKSMPLRFALSKQSRKDFTGGNLRIKTGCLNPGFAILTRARDFETIVKEDAMYYSITGRLVPSNLTESQLLTGRYDDPFKNITYAVFRIGMKATKLDPMFNYGS